MAGWLTEHWQATLWITDKEWLHARMNVTSGEDAALQRRDFARRAGLDEEASGIFAERQGNYRRGAPSVPLPTTASPRAASSRSAGATGGS